MKYTIVLLLALTGCMKLPMETVYQAKSCNVSSCVILDTFYELELCVAVIDHLSVETRKSLATPAGVMYCKEVTRIK